MIASDYIDPMWTAAQVERPDVKASIEKLATLAYWLAVRAGVKGRLAERFDVASWAEASAMDEDEELTLDWSEVQEQVELGAHVGATRWLDVSPEAAATLAEGLGLSNVNPSCTGSIETCHPECTDCGARDCPFNDGSHYEHDGCASCSQPQLSESAHQMNEARKMHVLPSRLEHQPPRRVLEEGQIIGCDNAESLNRILNEWRLDDDQPSARSRAFPYTWRWLQCFEFAGRVLTGSRTRLVVDGTPVGQRGQETLAPYVGPAFPGMLTLPLRKPQPGGYLMRNVPMPEPERTWQSVETLGLAIPNVQPTENRPPPEESQRVKLVVPEGVEMKGFPVDMSEVRASQERYEAMMEADPNRDPITTQMEAVFGVPYKRTVYSAGELFDWKLLDSLGTQMDRARIRRDAQREQEPIEPRALDVPPELTNPLAQHEPPATPIPRPVGWRGPYPVLTSEGVAHVSPGPRIGRRCLDCNAWLASTSPAKHQRPAGQDCLSPSGVRVQGPVLFLDLDGTLLPDGAADELIKRSGLNPTVHGPQDIVEWRKRQTRVPCRECNGRGWHVGDCHPREACAFCDGLGHDPRGEVVFPREACAALQRIVSWTGAQIVVSSAWRYRFGDAEPWPVALAGLQELFRLERLPVPVALTPLLAEHRSLSGIIGARPRREEIAAWLAQNPGARPWCALDDDPGAGPEGLILCDERVGLTQELAEQAIRALTVPRLDVLK